MTYVIWGGFLLLILVIVMLVFGTKKLRNVGQDLGGAVKGFKDGMKEGSSSTATASKQVEDQAGHTVEGEARKEETKA